MNIYYCCTVFVIILFNTNGTQNVVVAVAVAKDWWETAIFYQIYPRSFMDSNNDGIGDIKGITSKLQYLFETGINAIWLSPIFDSPMIDFGYDIRNFTLIHNEYGTMDDFDELIKVAKQLDIKILLDLVPNHTSDQCDWFIQSIKREKFYEDFYVWHDGYLDDNGNHLPPNNWQSVFYGSAWEWNNERNQFYLHQFTKEQPDLNYRNPNVVHTMNDIIKFWLNIGINGFRIDAVNHLFENEHFLNEPETNIDIDPKSYGFTHHYYTKDLTESVEMVFSWREILDEWKESYGGDSRVLMTEAYGNITSTMKFYENQYVNGSHIPFNFLLITEIDENSNANDFLSTINNWLLNMPFGKTANWVLGNHDKSRVGTRHGEHRIDAMNILLLTLPGIAITYNGEEIGMVDNLDINWEQTKDPAACNTNPEIYHKFTRDPVRTPYQWDDSINAGFSEAQETWLPIHSNYKTLNLKEQKICEHSHYKLYQQLITIRKHPTMKYGEFNMKAIGENVLTYTRIFEGHDTFLVIINFGNNNEIIDLNVFDLISDMVFVVIAGISTNYKLGDEILRNELEISSYDAIVLKSN